VEKSDRAMNTGASIAISIPTILMQHELRMSHTMIGMPMRPMVCVDGVRVFAFFRLVSE
jgi:hypothetical protein